MRTSVLVLTLLASFGCADSDPGADPGRAGVRAFAEAEQLAQQGEEQALRRAAERYEEALSLWRIAGDREQEALTEGRLGGLWFRLGELPTARARYEKALALVEALGLRDQKTSLLNDTGRVYRLLGETQKAFAVYREAIALARELGSRREETVSLNNLALLHKSIGEPWQALLLYDQALAGWRDLGDRGGEAFTLHNLGTIYTLLDRQPEALDALGRALELRRELNDARGEAATLVAVGWARFWSGQTPAAIDDLSRALELARAAGDRRGEAAALDRLGTVYLRLERTGEALAAFAEALEMSRDAGDRVGEANVLNNLGNAYAQRGDPPQALAYHRQALRLFQEMEDRNGEAYADFRIAHAERRRGDLRRARAAIEQALAVVESFRAASQSLALRASYFASVHDFYDFYVDLLMRLDEREPGQGYDRLALEAAERGRARSLLEALAVGHGGAADAPLAARRHALEQSIHAKERRRMELAKDASAGDELAAVEAELRDLLRQLDKQGVKSRADEVAAEPLRLAEIQQALDPETLLLSYALGEERSFLALVSPGGIRTYELPARAEIEAAALDLHRLLAASQKRAARVQARLSAAALGELLLGPVAADLGARRLLVVGDGALQYVPFAALLVPAENRPLMAEHEIVSSPSVSVLVALRRELAARSPAPGQLAVIADPVFRADDPRCREPADAGAPGAAGDLERAARSAGLDGFDRLPYSRREAEAILALASPDESLRALDFAASRETALSGRLARYRIVHFATHALVHPQHPELSGIVLSLVDERGQPRDGFLRLHEISSLDLPAELVVLSACRTALGKPMAGEGLVSLTRGFMHAGTPRVVVSLWNVNDQGTAELMRRFYRGLLRHGLRPAAALRAAQLSMLRDPQWQAPYYWAGFVLQGDWR